MYIGPRYNPYQTALNNYLPPLSSFPFGNNTFANLGNSNAFLSGNVPLEINSYWAQTGPELFPFMVGDDTQPGPSPQPLPSPYPQNKSQEQWKDQQGPLDVKADGETRLYHIFKLQLVAIIGIVVLAIGLYLIIRQTDTYKKAQSAVIDAAEVAALA